MSELPPKLRRTRDMVKRLQVDHVFVTPGIFEHDYQPMILVR